MTKHPIIFGTDGWRGLIGPELNDENILLAAQAFAQYVHNNTIVTETPGVAVGYDGRTNSKHFAALFAEVLSGNGITAYLSDSIIPTPTLSYYVKYAKLNAGVMITASHNPPAYNGVKFKAAYGGPFVTEETVKVEQLIGTSKILRSNVLVKLIDMMPPYFQQLEKYIDFAAIKKADIKIAIDSMGGAGQSVLQTLLEKHGCSASTIFEKTDEHFFGRAPEPIEQNLKPLHEFLSNHTEFSFGAATDGDADRLGVLLDNREWLSAQYTILLLNDYFVNTKHISGGLIKTSSVTDKIRRLASTDRKVFEVQVGFKYICELMVSADIAIGCEESGGYGYKNHIPERDGILSALIVAEMLAKSGCKKLSEYVDKKIAEYGPIFYDRIDYKYEQDNRVKILPRLGELPPKTIIGLSVTEVQEFLSSRGIVNGLKFILTGECRWLLIRASETEPLVRFYAEGQSAEEVKQLLQAGVDLIHSTAVVV
jgi:phosphomannomutase